MSKGCHVHSDEARTKHLQRLCFGLLNKAASVHHNGVCILMIIHNLKARPEQVAQHDLAWSRSSTLIMHAAVQSVGEATVSNMAACHNFDNNMLAPGLQLVQLNLPKLLLSDWKQLAGEMLTVSLQGLPVADRYETLTVDCVFWAA